LARLAPTNTAITTTKPTTIRMVSMPIVIQT
jgi:hypothetical protein